MGRMILVDTSVWIDHFRRENAKLASLLGAMRVVVHPFVIGELALGSLRNRRQIISHLVDLPAATAATDGETLAFIDSAGLAGSGVGYVDAHLLASTMLTPDAEIWTLDTKLRSAATRLDLQFRAEE